MMSMISVVNCPAIDVVLDGSSESLVSTTDKTLQLIVRLC